MSAFLLCFIAFVFGYLAASWFDLNQFIAWTQSHWTSSSVKAEPIRPQAKAPPARPKLEFYTLLANESMQRPVAVVASRASTPTPHVALVPALEKSVAVMPSSPHTVKIPPPAFDSVLATNHATVKPVGHALERPAAGYSVQVGSFKQLYQAQRMKADLVMKGFDVEITTVTQQQVQWYRVVAGPFISLPLAQKIQMAIARQAHISGMIRKSEA